MKDILLPLLLFIYIYIKEIQFENSIAWDTIYCTNIYPISVFVNNGN